MSVPSSPLPEVPPSSSHDELLEQLRNLDIAVKPDIDDRTANVLTQLIDRLADGNLRQYLNDAFASNKSCEASKSDKDSGTATPIPIDPLLNAVNTPSDNVAGHESAQEDVKDQMSDDCFCFYGRFTGRPITVMVNGTGFVVHERIFESIFPHEVAPDADGILEVNDISEILFEKVLQGEYGGSHRALERLDRGSLEMVQKFALNHGSMPLLSAIYQMSYYINPFEKETLAQVADIYCWHQELPEFRAYFRESLRGELPYQLADGSSRAFISSLANALKGAGNAMEDVSMVLHDLWISSTARAKPLEADLEFQEIFDSPRANIEGNGWANSANDVKHMDANDSSSDFGNERVDNKGTGVISSNSGKVPTAYHSASDPFLPQGGNATFDIRPPTPTHPLRAPRAPLSPASQYIWGHRTSRRLNTPSFEPPPAPISFDAAPRDRPVPLRDPSVLVPRIFHWLSLQLAKGGCSTSFEAPEIASSIGCLVTEAEFVLAQLVKNGLVETHKGWGGEQRYKTWAPSYPGWN